MIEVSPAALAGWYADPLDPEQASAMLDAAAGSAQDAYRHGRPATGAELQQVIAGFWLGRPFAGRLDTLAESIDPAGTGALAVLVHGQLLMCRRLPGAMERLDQGFERARDLFLPGDFFVVMKRHGLLAELPLADEPRAAMGLDALLQEARVIRRLRGERRRPSGLTRSGDTTG